MRRRFSIIGDSISTFAGCNPDGYAVYFDEAHARVSGLAQPSDTWWAQVIAHFDGELAVNGSYSGSMAEGAGFPAGQCAERAEVLADAGSPDDVVVFLGINDYGWGGPLAQAAGRSAAVPACVDLARVEPRVAGVAPVGAAKRFGEAYATMLRNVRAACPEARIWCCTLLPGRLPGAAGPTFAWRLRGVSLRAYNEQIARAARACACRLVDTAAFGRDYEAVDGTHPTRRGMRQIAALVVAAMEGTPLDESSFAPGGFFSHDPCGEAACVGCAHARSTSNQWSCVCELALEEGTAPREISK